MTTSQDGEGGDSHRTNILTRISKMGQSMLPVGASPGSVSEDDMVSGLSYKTPCIQRPLGPLLRPRLCTFISY